MSKSRGDWLAKAWMALFGLSRNFPIPGLGKSQEQGSLWVGDEQSKEKLSGYDMGRGERVQKSREMCMVIAGLLAKSLTMVGP